MFFDWKQEPPPPPWQPEPQKRRVTKRDETVLFWIVGINLLLVLLSPFAGASVIQAVAALLGK